jgi:hypothetical protein
MIYKDLANKIRDLLIIREDDGSYNLFGKYKVTESNAGYNIIVDNEPVNYSFSSLKTAVTWCVFDKNKKYKEVKRLIELDLALGGIDVAIAQHKRLLTKSHDLIDKQIFMAKLVEEKRKKQELSQEIQGYITTSKYMQSKKFAENEIR